MQAMQATASLSRTSSSSFHFPYLETPEEITPRTFWKKLHSKTSLAHFGVSVTFALLVAVTVVWGYPFFMSFSEHLIASLTLMTFIVLILLPRESWDGFFMIVGIGYGFFSLFRVLYFLTFPWVDVGISDQKDRSLQLQLSFYVLELLGFGVGLVFARKVFVGLKPVIVTALFFLFISFFFLSAIFWWDFFSNLFSKWRQNGVQKSR